MTENAKDLLLRDLCARLPYGVKIESADENIITLTGIILPNHYSTINGVYSFDSYPMKPYLFPMSNMTEEQDKEYALLQTSPGKEGFLYVWNCATMMKWLIENRFDYNGLIPKGLANDATGKNIY